SAPSGGATGICRFRATLTSASSRRPRGHAASSCGPPLRWPSRRPITDVVLTITLPSVSMGDYATGLVAQLVEQRTENPRVGGSTPSQATNLATIHRQRAP